MIYKGYQIIFIKKKASNEYQVVLNGETLTSISFKKHNIVATNNAFTKAKNFINSIE